MRGKRWTEQELKLAFHLYCQLPFGRLHRGNPEINELARALGRTSSAVAMKLVNFASLDPAIIASGRKGLDGASRHDREIWERFNADWEGLAVECARLRQSLSIEKPIDAQLGAEEAEGGYFVGETRQALVEQRVKQRFFRRAVLSSYRNRCCMSGLAVPRLLVASHIVPWSRDSENRLNPANGLCLSALHDRAFDQGLLAVSNELTVVVSEQLSRQADAFTRQTMSSLAGKPIEVPERFLPQSAFLTWHRENIFVG